MRCSVIPSAARNLGTLRIDARRPRSLASLGMTLLFGGTLAAQAIPSGGDGTLYVGTYARQILVLDEATMQVRDTIRVTVGIPELSLSFNRKNLYVSDPRNEKLEIIELATKRQIASFTLSNDSTKVQMWGFSLDPKERFAVLLVKTYTKQRDRFEIGPPTLLRYDLAKHAVTDTIPWPKGEER